MAHSPMDREQQIDLLQRNHPDLERSDIAKMLDLLDIKGVKEEFWKDNPTLPEKTVDDIVAQNIAASYDYHLYHTLNDEAS